MILDALAVMLLNELEKDDISGKNNQKTVVELLEDVIDKAKDEERKEVLGE